MTDQGQKRLNDHAPMLDRRLAQIVAASAPLECLDVEAMRAHARKDKSRWSEGVRVGLGVVDTVLDTPAGQRPLRIVTPPKPRKPPVVFIHGGGWTTCDLDTHLALFAGLARAANRQVKAPHARQAPEHPYPAPLEDTIAALRHATLACPEGFFLAGDSAGANLAIAAVLQMRDAGERPPVFAILAYYGCYRRLFDTSSNRRFGDGSYDLSTEKMRRFWSLYCGDAAATPSWADLSRQALGDLPPIQVHAAEADPLHDDSIWLHDTILAAGGRSEFVTWPGMTHGFLHYLNVLPQARKAFAKSAKFLAAQDPIGPTS